MYKILCILQARMSSTRLPGKVLMEINNKPLLGYELSRVKKSKLITKIVIATSKAKEDDQIENFCKNSEVDCFRGDLNDVLKRYYDCAMMHNSYDIIVRITGDCPLIDENVIDKTIELFLSSDVDYCSNTDVPTFPDGLDVEVFLLKSLKEAYNNALLPSEREHVTPYIRKHYRKINYALEKFDYSSYRFTVDEQKDFELVKLLIQNVGSENGYIDYIQYINENGININNDIIRNEGSLKSLKEDYTFIKNN